MKDYLEKNRLAELEVGKEYVLEVFYSVEPSLVFKILEKREDGYSIVNINDTKEIAIYPNKTNEYYNFYYNEGKDKIGINFYEVIETKIFLLERKNKDLDETIKNCYETIRKNERKLIENIVEIAKLKKEI